MQSKFQNTIVNAMWSLIASKQTWLLVMGSSLRFNYFLTILWLNVYLLNCSIDTSNTTCSHNCEYQVSGSEVVNKTCTITDNACNQYQTPSWVQMETIAEAVPGLADIEIYSFMQSNMFNISFLIPQSFQNETQAFQVQFIDFNQSGESICQTIQFMETFSPDADTFSYDCYSDVQPNKTYVMTLKNPLHDVTVSYLIFTPQVINQSANQEDWETVISVLILPTEGNYDTFDITVVFQPAFYSVNDYMVEMRLNQVFSRRYLYENQTNVVFDTFAIKTEDLIQITVTPQGCQGSCKETRTPFFSRFARSIETTSTTTTATTASKTSTTSSKTSTTSTTSFPPQTKGTPENVTTTTEDPSVIMKPANKEEYQRSVEIIFGTVAGVTVLVVIAIVTFCVCKKRRQFMEGGFQMERFGNNRESGSSLGTNQGFKHQPSVLVLYSYDCAPHEKVVTSFSNYLQNVMNCEVILDLWEKAQIQQHNEYQWLQTRFLTCQFVIVICSAGARYKCARHKKFRMKTLNKSDTFAWAVDYTGELMRTTKKGGESLAKFITVYFDYASKSDIPPKLDLANSFSMMKDVFQLYCHLHWIQKDSLDSNDNLQHRNNNEIQFESFHKNEHGKKLQEALSDAVQYFKDNPDWIANTLEPVNPIHSAVQDNVTRGKKKGENQEPDSKVKTKDQLLVERRKKRKKDEENDIDKMPPNNSVTKIDLDAEVYAPSHSRVPSNSSTSSQVPLVVNGNTRSIPKLGFSKFSQSSPNRADKIGLVTKEEELEDAMDEDAQLQKDLEFITNFDKIKQNETKQKQEDITLELHGYTPPEDYLYFASLEDTLTDNGSNESPYTHLHSNGIALETTYTSLHRNGHYVIDFPQMNEDKLQIVNRDIDRTTGTKEIKL